MAKMIYGVEDKPKIGELLIFALQQFLAIIAATITVPILIGAGDHVSAALLGAGLGTLVYVLCTKGKSPVMLSSSFAFIGALSAALMDYGYLGIVIGGLFAGTTYVVVSIFVKLFGTNWIERLMPPIVIGPVVACIGLSLAPSAISNLLRAEGFTFEGQYPLNLLALLCGIVTFFVIVVCSLQKWSKTLKMVPFLIGIAAGYLLAVLFTLIGVATGNTYLQIIDFSPLVKSFSPVTITSFFSYPRFALLESIQQIQEGGASINGMAILELGIAFVPVSLVALAEHIADHKNLGSIIGRDLVGKEPGLHRTILGDGLGSIAGTVFGVCPNTTYGESIGCTAISKNASIRTILVTVFICILASFLSPISNFIQTLPSCVVGGACLALYGFIAASGMKMLRGLDITEGKNLFVSSSVFIPALGQQAIAIPYELGYLNGTSFYGVAKSISIGAIAFGLLLGILTNRLCVFLEKRHPKEESECEEEEAKE